MVRMITTSWPCGQEVTRVKRDGGVGRGSALGSPTLRDTEAYCGTHGSPLLLTRGGPQEEGDALLSLLTHAWGI